MLGWKKQILSFIYQYKGNNWFTQTIKEMLDNFEKEIRAEAIDEFVNVTFESLERTKPEVTTEFQIVNVAFMKNWLSNLAEQLKEQK